MQKRISKLLLSLCIMCISLVAFSTSASAAYVTYIVGSGSEGMGTVGISTDMGTTITKGDVNKLSVASGTTVLLFAYPNEGYAVDKIGGFVGTSVASLSTVPYGTDGTYVAFLTMESDDFIGYASFEENITYYTVTAASSDSTMGTVSGGGTVASGSSATITATANDGYVFAGWYNGDTLVSSDASYTVSSLTADATYTAKFAQAVAKIGDMYYTTLQEAIDAAPSGDTETAITLLCDITESVTTTQPVNRNIVLDLDGHTWNASSGVEYALWNTLGSITIKNGTVNSGTSYAIMNTSTGTMILDDVDIYYNGTSFAMGNAGTLTVSNGTTFNAPDGTAIIVQNNSKTTINDSTIIGALARSNNAGDIIINSGTFSQDPTDYLAAGKIATYDGTYYTVTDDESATKVAKIGETYYLTLQAAVDAAKASGVETTITLLEDVDEAIIVSGDITFDLNGHTWNSSKSYTLQLASGNVTVKNGTLSGGTSYTAVTAPGTSLTLTDVSVNASASAVAAMGNVVINGDSEISGASDTLWAYSGNITVESGTVTGGFKITNSGTITVTGGTFSQDPSDYVSEGISVVTDDIGNYVVNAYIVTAATTEGGSVTGGGVAISGGSVTLTATPDADYRFLGWYDGDTKVSSDATFTVNNVSASKTYTAKFILKEIVDAEAFEMILDSGYYGTYNELETARGVIAFNAFYKNYATAENIEKFGLFVYVEGGTRVGVEATAIDELIAKGGKFFIKVSDISYEYHDSQVYAMPYVVIDGSVYYGNAESTSVNTEKWLGEAE